MKKVLVTEDDLVSNLLLSALIRDQGFKTVSAYSIKEMREVIGDDSFDFVFLDNKLSDGHGIDFLPELRAQQPEARIVVISAESFEDNIQRALTSGANEFLSKPLSHAEIRRVLGTLK